ncbi:early nodulin-like protein 5 [Nicotiana tabacum]|uniref:Early nodulin-like protein 5 n=1 Tax=Nicotiana tabacum TaxID=4097 RepID=A0A1S3X8R6_TOBAC
MTSSKGFLYLVFVFSLHFFTALSTEFTVGGDKGWVVPQAKDDQVYNEWAAKNRFKVNDTLRFEYNKDSVLVVTEAEYEKCKSAHPIFFSNNGTSIYKLDRPGLFYFISGVSGHCDKGMKMIVKVLEKPETPPQVSNQTTGGTSSPTKSGATQLSNVVASPSYVMVFLVSFFGTIFI